MRAFRNWVHARGRGYYGYMQMTSATEPIRPIRPEQPDRLARPALLRARRRDLGADAALDRRGRERRECGPPSTGWTSSAATSSTTMPGELVEPWPTRSSWTTDSTPSTSTSSVPCSTSRATTRGSRAASSSISAARTCRRTTATPRRDRPPDLRRRPPVGHPAARRADGGARSVPLILCVDQLEDIYDLDDAAGRFRRALATLCDLASRMPNGGRGRSPAWKTSTNAQGGAHQAVTDRIEKDPAPIELQGPPRGGRGRPDRRAAAAIPLRFPRRLGPRG